MSVSRLFFASLLLVLAVAANATTLPDVRRVEFDNGVVLLQNVKNDVPLVGVSARLKGGAAQDPADRHGLASLYAGLLSKGAGDRDTAAFAEAIEAVGGRLNAYADLESITVSGDFLARDTDLMIELLSDMLVRPHLDSQEFEKLKLRSINLSSAAKDSDPGQILPSYANAWLFGDHPYGNPIDGSEASLAAIEHADVLAYHDVATGGDRLVIAISGDIDADQVEASLREALGDWRPATGELAPMAGSDASEGRRVLLIDKPGATQTYFWIGNRGVAIDFERRADLDIANTLFGGRFTSMLNKALRVEAGLTYSARSVLDRPLQPGTVSIRSYTATATTTEAIDLALATLDRLHAEPFDDASIASALNYIDGQFPMLLETAPQLASMFARLEHYGLDNDYIDGYADRLKAVTSASAASVVAEVYPTPDELVFVLIGDADEIRDMAAQYGEVTEISISEPTFHVDSD